MYPLEYQRNPFLQSPIDHSLTGNVDQFRLLQITVNQSRVFIIALMGRGIQKAPGIEGRSMQFRM